MRHSGILLLSLRLFLWSSSCMSCHGIHGTWRRCPHHQFMKIVTRCVLFIIITNTKYYRFFFSNSQYLLVEHVHAWNLWHKKFSRSTTSGGLDIGSDHKLSLSLFLFNSFFVFFKMIMIDQPFYRKLSSHFLFSSGESCFLYTLTLTRRECLSKDSLIWSEHLIIITTP